MDASLPLPYRFTAPVSAFDSDDGRFLVHHYLPIPVAMAADLRAQRMRRLKGTLNGHAFNLALHNRAGEEERFLLLSRATLRTLKARLGEAITVVCEPEANGAAVEIPEELLEVLAQEDAARARFETLTPGRRRSIAYYVGSAKTIDTRIKRALELAHKLRTHTLYGDLNPEKRKREA